MTVSPTARFHPGEAVRQAAAFGVLWALEIRVKCVVTAVVAALVGCQMVHVAHSGETSRQMINK